MKTILFTIFGLIMLAGSLAMAEVPAATPEPTTPTVEQSGSNATPADVEQERHHKGIRIQMGGEDTGGVDVDKLNPEDQAEIAKSAMSSPVAIIGVFIPIVAIVMSIGLVIIIIALESKRKRQQNEIIREAIAKGVEPPVFPEKKKDPIRTGIIMSAFGLGIGLALGITSEEMRTAALGLILLLPGIGYLVYGLMRRNGNSNGNGH
jgi:hypothetical protein